MSQMVIKRTGEVVDFDGDRIRVAISKAIRATAPPDSGTRSRTAPWARWWRPWVGEIDTRFTELYPNVENIQDIVEKHLVKNGLYEDLQGVHSVPRRAPAGARTAQGPGRPPVPARQAHRARPRRARGAVRHRQADAQHSRRGARHRPQRRRGARRRDRRRRGGARDHPQHLRRHLEHRNREGAAARERFVHRARPRLQPARRAPVPAPHLQGGDRRPAGPRQPRRGLPERVPRRHPARRGGRHVRQAVARLRLRAHRRRAAAGTRRPVPVHGRADAARTLLHAGRWGGHRDAAGVLDARRHGPGAARERSRGAGDPFLRVDFELALRALDADPVSRRHQPSATQLLLPDHHRRRPRQHLQGARRQRAALQVVGRARQRLEQHPRHRRHHPQHRRGEPGRDTVPEDRQRRDPGHQPQRQAPRRHLRLSRNLAPGHRGFLESAPQHRRRAAPHARHEHRQLDSRSVHEAGSRRPGVDAVLPGRDPDLHHLYGRRFEQRYRHYEELARAGKLRRHRTLPAAKLWRKMLGMLFETGHPWITFKDACNIRSPQTTSGW